MDDKSIPSRRPPNHLMKSSYIDSHCRHKLTSVLKLYVENIFVNRNELEMTTGTPLAKCHSGPTNGRNGLPIQLTLRPIA